MFKKLLTFTAIIVLSLFLVVPSQATFKDMWAQVYSWDGGLNGDGTLKLTEVTTGITFQVLQAGSDTIETLYEYGTTTSLTNPVTTTNYALATVMKAAGVLSFKVDPGEANDVAVDLVVVDTAGGYTKFVEDFDQYTHSIVIDERPNVKHQGTIWFSVPSSTETDSGIDFDYDTFIHDVWVETVTVDAGETLDVGTLSGGTDGDANGFRTLVSVAAAGFTKDTGIITNHASADYTAVSTYGADLYTALTGTSAHAAGASNSGGRTYIGHVITGANEQSLTYTGSAGCDTAAGYIHYFFTRMR